MNGHGPSVSPGGLPQAPTGEGVPGTRLPPNYMFSSFGAAAGRAQANGDFGGSRVNQHFNGPSNVYFFQNPGQYKVDNFSTYTMRAGSTPWSGYPPPPAPPAAAPANRVSTSTHPLPAIVELTELPSPRYAIPSSPIPASDAKGRRGLANIENIPSTNR